MNSSKLLPFIALVSMVHIGCSKEADKVENLHAMLNQPYKFESFNPPVDSIPLILADFKAQSERVVQYAEGKVSIDPNLEDLSIESALWTLEGAINSHYSFPLSSWQDELMDTLYFSVANVPDSTGQHEVLVSGYDLSLTYWSLIQQIDILILGNEELIMSDIKYVSHDSAFTQFLMIMFTGYPYVWSVSEDVFTSGDDWFAGDALGQCTGMNVGLDAADRLSQAANWNIKYGFVQNFYGTHWTNMPAYHTGIVTVWGSTMTQSSVSKLLGQQNDVAGAVQSYCQGPKKPVDFCVQDSDMQLYYHEIWPIVGAYQPTNPFKDVLYVRLIDYPFLCTNDPIQPVYCLHDVNYINYGIPIFQQ